MCVCVCVVGLGYCCRAVRLLVYAVCVMRLFAACVCFRGRWFACLWCVLFVFVYVCFVLLLCFYVRCGCEYVLVFLVLCVS